MCLVQIVYFNPLIVGSLLSECELVSETAMQCMSWPHAMLCTACSAWVCSDMPTMADYVKEDSSCLRPLHMVGKVTKQGAGGLPL